MVLKIFEMFRLGSVIEQLKAQKINYPISTAYKLVKISEEIEEMEKMVFERVDLVIHKDLNDFDSFTDDEKKIYEVILVSEIEIDLKDLKIEDILSDEAKLSIEDTKTITDILKLA